MSACPSENDLIMLIGKRLDAQLRQQLHAHIRVCDRCFAAVANMVTADELSASDSGTLPAESTIEALLSIGSIFKDRF